MEYAAYVSALLAVAAWHLLILHLSPILGLIKLNFRHEAIPASYGIILLGYVLAGLAFLAAVFPHTLGLVIPVMITASSMCLLGFVDDIYGSREASGFRGHFTLLFQQGKVTTGAIKAIGGGITGVAMGCILFDGDSLRWVLSALLIPLGANTLNLLDLRPGRACGAMLFALLMFSPFAFFNGSGLIITFIFCVTLAFAVWDGRAKAMMGDSGSNQLGAVLGIIVATQTPVLFQITIIAFMIGIQIYSEKHSISELIGQNPLLRKIDRILGVR